jgi:two-component system sensor histidine kinase HydH
MVIMRPDGAGAYTQVLPEEPEEALLPFLPGHAIVDLLVRDREAFTVDTLRRMKPTPLTEDALKALAATGAELMVGSFMRKQMKAMVFLFQKESGRFYDSQDQRALQLLCNQLAVALENASLYTTVQDGKIYNDILLDSLASGIVAANSDRIVTVFNRRARGLTGLPELAVVGQPMTVLPPALGDGLSRILNTQAGFRDQDMFITHGNEEVPVRVSGTHFRSHNGERFGALLVFNDMTALRKMEEQIRRNDRLSSLGTLSAGMAHEIKNPLVTIKTFTQLLPRQYQDAEFRQTFFELVGREVSRIDVIVNRLLEFSGPAKAMLRQASLHGIIEHSLRLVGHQLVLNGIRLERHLEAANDTIHADTEQLNQAFVNLLLNAVHAMNEGDTLTVRTSVMVHSEEIPQIAGAPDGDRIQVDIQDTGCGIAPEDLRRIFDPFFTTKASGVGLGLSVSHGIIQEHGGTIEVESERGKGTVFHLRFPLMNSPEKKDI